LLGFGIIINILAVVGSWVVNILTVEVLYVIIELAVYNRCCLFWVQRSRICESIMYCINCTVELMNETTTTIGDMQVLLYSLVRGI